MILDMTKDATRKWIAVVIAGSDGNHSGSKLNQLVDAEGWDDRAIDFRVTMNGVEFTEVDELFDRLHEHFTEQNDRIKELESELNLK